MEDHDAGERLGLLDALDRDPLRDALGIPARGHDDADRRVFGSSAGSSREVSRRRGLEEIEPVAVEAGNEHLGLGIAEPRVVLEDLRPVPG
jgi:hypothetical protein